MPNCMLRSDNFPWGPSNISPVADDDSFTLDQDTSLAIDLLANDTDLDLDSLTVFSINDVTLAGGSQTINVPNGQVDVAANGTDLTLTPDAGYFGPISFDYVVTDGTDNDTGSVSVTVNQVIPPHPYLIS